MNMNEGSIFGATLALYTQRNLFQIALNQTQIRLYLPCTDWFGTANRRSPFAIPNQSCCMVNTIWFGFDLIRFKKDYLPSIIAAPWWAAAIADHRPVLSLSGLGNVQEIQGEISKGRLSLSIIGVQLGAHLKQVGAIRYRDVRRISGRHWLGKGILTPLIGGILNWINSPHWDN